MDLYLQLNDGYIYFILYNQYLPPLWLVWFRLTPMKVVLRNKAYNNPKYSQCNFELFWHCNFVFYFLSWELWCLTPLSTIYQLYIVAGFFVFFLYNTSIPGTYYNYPIKTVNGIPALSRIFTFFWKMAANLILSDLLFLIVYLFYLVKTSVLHSCNEFHGILQPYI